MSLASILETQQKLILFGGKGGVGKTTCAASAAVKLARSGQRTLVFSTDPAHSLADSLGFALNNTVQPVAGEPNLFALEVNAAQMLEQFKAEYGDEITDLFKTATYLDDQDIENVTSLDIPGLDELMSFKRIMDFLDEEAYDRYVVDTAPTGHTLRLLNLPDLIDNWVKMLAKMKWKYRYMVQRFSGKNIEEKEDFLFVLKRTVKKVRAILKDSAQSEFVPVTIAEAMGVLETRRLAAELREIEVPVKHLVINNLIPADVTGGFYEKRRATQQKYVAQLREEFTHLEITEVPLQPDEIRGLDALRGVGDILFAPPAR
jgi:arsenite-transporting ATPase